jgi:hypothetical protein
MDLAGAFIGDERHHRGQAFALFQPQGRVEPSVKDDDRHRRRAQQRPRVRLRQSAKPVMSSTPIAPAT